MMDSLSLGVVETDPSPLLYDGPQGARYCEVLLVPEDILISARIANLGQGSGRGLFAPVRRGDEVLVFFPGDDRQQAVILGGLGSAGGATNPTANDGNRLLLLHPDEVVLSTTDAGALLAQGVVLEQLVEDLAEYVTAFETFILACSVATVAPQIAAAAVTFMATTQKAAAAPSAFLAQLQAAIAAGQPYIAKNVKAGD